MEVSTITTSTKCQQITVDIPEDRVDEFHAFVARFLVRPAGLRRGRRIRRHGGVHRHGCSLRRGAADSSGAHAQTTGTTAV